MSDTVFAFAVSIQSQFQLGPSARAGFFSELCLGKAMAAYTMPQQRRKEERSDQIY